MKTLDHDVLLRPDHRRWLIRCLEADVGAGDLTTDSLVETGRQARGRIRAGGRLVVAGLPLAMTVFTQLDPEIEIGPTHAEGQEAREGETIAEIRGEARAILTAERTALNLLARLSGVATAARRAVEAVAGTGAVVLDTRKTTPGLRPLEKYAVAVGGATNHRSGLDEAVLIKDNHRALLGASPQGLAEAIARARHGTPAGTLIEVEVDSLAELEAALAAGPDRILIDNFAPEAARDAVVTRDRHARETGARIPLEASGGIRPETARRWAEHGVDFVSIGWMTHSAPAADLSLEIVD